MRKCLWLLVFLIVVLSMQAPLNAQIGGLGTYDFLSFAPSARSTALSSANIGIKDQDPTLGFLNPALINDKMKNKLGIQHNFHLADIGHGHVGFGWTTSSNINIMTGVQYVNYGDFIRSDVFGNQQGNFSGSDAAIIVGVAKQLDERLSGGISLKMLSSNYENYSSLGIAADIGIQYQDSSKLSSWAVVIKNIGSQISSYNDIKQPLPFDLQIGYTKRLRHLPLRWMITASHLHRWNLRSPQDDVSSTIFIDRESTGPSAFSKTIDNLFRHLTFGGELLIGAREAFQLRFGYNHLRARELSEEGFRSLSGLSLGFGVQVKKIQFNYGMGRYHLAGSAHHLGLQIDLDELFSKL